MMEYAHLSERVKTLQHELVKIAEHNHAEGCIKNAPHLSQKYGAAIFILGAFRNRTSERVWN